MKILRVIARLNVGGPAKHVVLLTAGLRDCETVLVAGTVPPGEDDMGYFAADLGVNPVFIPEMSREISLKDAVTIWKLYRLFVREQPDIVHTHTAKAGTVGRVAGLLYRWLTPGALIGRRRSCKFVHTYHGHIFHSYYGHWKTRTFIGIERALARVATDRIVVITEQQRKEINETFHVGKANQFAVIPLGLDLNVFSNWRDHRQPLRSELQVADDDILVGIVGRITEIKNHELFLKAAAEYKRQLADASLPRVRFIIIGDGNLREHLQKKSTALGLDNDVVFTGTRNDPQVFYPALDIVALTSLNEGTPLTLIEAMMNERPVVATAVGGVIDLLGPVRAAGDESFSTCDRGILVETNNAFGFAAGLASLIKDEELRSQLGRRGREFVQGIYSKDRLISDVTKLYGDLLQKERTIAKNDVLQNQPTTN